MAPRPEYELGRGWTEEKKKKKEKEKKKEKKKKMIKMEIQCLF